ncbi:predicted protein [Nematostella vectensis]|uniref:Laminin G domain-containing protein n=1 Tax=Nematostella vectensis TaxID=45351 RepID=A7S8N4_NEMVE|nr:predicted protein [Nematostella vectensis]|eukprot:XP_001631963.1 predicted protein [Nematostella vectensis]
MLQDWKQIDFEGIARQAMWTFSQNVEKDYAKIKEIHTEFTQLLDQQATIDQYAEWASSLVDRCVTKGWVEFERGGGDLSGLTSSQFTFCTSESSSVWLNGSGYIRYNVAKETRSKTPLRNFIGFRFRTSSKEGVLLYTSVERTHLVVEMISGNVVLKMDLGKGELVLSAGDGLLNDNRWHWVEIKRRGRHAKLVLDGREGGKGPAPGTSSNLILIGGKEAVYFGGGPSKDDLEKSYSKTNFSGFLQQFLFDDYKVLDKVLKKRKRDGKFTKHGIVVNAKVRTTKAAPTTKPVPTTPMEGSGSCANKDDEDCVPKDSIKPTETTDNSSMEWINTTDSVFHFYTESKQSSDKSMGVPAWIITIAVVAAVISIFITIFLVYRWNTRYSGSFSTASAVPKPEQSAPSPPTRSWPEPPVRIPVVHTTIPTRSEHPKIYISSYDKV